MPYAMLARTVSLKRIVCWLTTPIRARRDNNETSRMSTPSIRIAPFWGS